MSQPKDVLVTLAFNPQRRVLVGGTLAGRLCFWHFIGSRIVSSASSAAVIEPSESDWEVWTPVNLQQPITGLDFGIADWHCSCLRLDCVAS